MLWLLLFLFKYGPMSHGYGQSTPNIRILVIPDLNVSIYSLNHAVFHFHIELWWISTSLVGSLYTLNVIILQQNNTMFCGLNYTKGKALHPTCFNYPSGIANMLYCVSFCPLWLPRNFQINFLIPPRIYIIYLCFGYMFPCFCYH